MTLADHDLKLGDIVTYDPGIGPTGGVIYRIVYDAGPVAGEMKTTPKRRRWGTSNVSRFYLTKDGKKIGLKEHTGYVRLKPEFDFFATKLGKKPGGENGTKVVHYDDIKKLNKVDITALGVKYLELGNFMRSIALENGMEVTSDAG